MIQYDKPENIRPDDYCLAEVAFTHSRLGRSGMIRTCSCVERFDKIVRLKTASRDRPFEVPVEAISSVWRHVSPPATHEPAHK